MLGVMRGLTILLVASSLPLAVLVFTFKVEASERQSELASLRREIAVAQAQSEGLALTYSMLSHPTRIAVLAQSQLGWTLETGPRYRTIGQLPFMGSDQTANLIRPSALELFSTQAALVPVADLSRPEQDTRPPGWRPVGEDPLATLIESMQAQSSAQEEEQR